MTESSATETHDVVTERLVSLYERFFGEPEQLSDVYVGFSLFFGGVAMAVVGVVVFLWSSTLPGQLDSHWQLREIAISLAMLGLPTFLMGVVVLLKTDRRALAGGSIGIVLCLGAVGVFVANYPHNWNVPGADASTTGITVYAAGITFATAAVGGALVSNYVARADSSATEGAASSEASADETESVSDEQVRKDIEDAMSGSELSWGGVEKDDTKRLQITTDDSDIDRSGFDNVEATEQRASGTDVDDAVDGLQQLRGGNTDEATGEGTDEQTDALRQLREQQNEEQPESEQGFVARLRERLGL